MSLLFFEYSAVLISFLFSFFLGFLIFILAYFFSYSKPDFEKLSAYECGFDPFEDSRNQFDIRFYLIALLFLIFDLEASFLFPWAVTLQVTGFFGFYLIADFFIELIVGFYYVWIFGALDWS